MTKPSAPADPRQAPKPASASRVIMTELVIPEDTNPQGNIFGGRVMALIDKSAAVVGLRHCRSQVATASVDSLTFHSPIRLGSIVVLGMEVPHRFYLDAFRADESRVLEKRGPVSLNLRHDGGMGPDQPRAFGSQSRGLLELSLDLEAECLRGPETPGSLANGTRAAQEAFQSWSGPVSGDLDQAELANRQYPAPRPVRLQLLFQSSSQFLAVLLVLQVDEIYDQNPTEIPEPDLSDYFPCSL